MAKKILSLDGLMSFWEKVNLWISTNFQNIFDNLESIENALVEKFDKAGGTVEGNVTFKGNVNIGDNTSDNHKIIGTTTFSGKVVLPTGSNVGTVLDIPGNLGIGSTTDPNVTGRIITSRKVASPNFAVVSKSSLGYNPIANTAATYDYGMKYQVQYDAGIDKYDAACFYLSWNECVVGFSGAPNQRISKFYTVLHSGNAYMKDETDIMLNVLKSENEELRRQINVLRLAVESLGVDVDSIDNEYEMPQSRMLGTIDYIQSKERGYDAPEETTE